MDLYGFPTEEDLRFFKQLMGISGIGPKTALGIMSVTDVMTLKRAIARGDAATLTKVFGIGKKSAERMVVELRDKLQGELSSDAPQGIHAQDSGEVIEALMALGYRADEARQALKEIDPSIEGTKERLASTLRYLGTTKQ
jgi:Holliday junction DNA helicase RuvA